MFGGKSLGLVVDGGSVNGEFYVSNRVHSDGIEKIVVPVRDDPYQNFIELAVSLRVSYNVVCGEWHGWGGFERCVFAMMNDVDEVVFILHRNTHARFIELLGKALMLRLTGKTKAKVTLILITNGRYTEANPYEYVDSIMASSAPV